MMNQDVSTTTKLTGIGDEGSTPTSKIEERSSVNPMKMEAKQEVSSPAENTSTVEEVRAPISETKRRSSFSMLKMVINQEVSSSFSLTGIMKKKTADSDTEAKPKKPRSSSKKWMKSRQSRKFTFSSPEEYMEYAARKSSVRVKREKNSEGTPKKSRSLKSWKKIRKESEDNTPKNAKQRNTMTTEVMALDDTLDVTIDVTGGYPLEDESSLSNYMSSDDDYDYDDYDEEEPPDVETNNVASRDTDKSPRCKKICSSRRKMTFSDVWRVVALWAVMAVIALYISWQLGNKDPAEALLQNTTNTTFDVNVGSFDDNVGCSLCPSGTSVVQSEIELYMTDFPCQSDESSCFFQCSSPQIPKLYTCGDIEKIASGVSCNGENESCFDFQTTSAVSECCVSSFEKMAGEYAAQTDLAVNQLRMNGN